MTETFVEVFDNIVDWGHKRGILFASSSQGQVIKLGEEFGELCNALIKEDKDTLSDAIGDMVVVLTLLAAQQQMDIRDCIEGAYAEISKRKGYMHDGIFIKED